MSDVVAWVVAALAVVFAGLLYFIYDGYLRLLRVIHHMRRSTDSGTTATADPPPTIAVVVTVHNEAHQIVERIQNVFDQEYPSGLLQMIVASDGSDDGLAEVIAEHFGDAVQLIHAPERVGKSLIQNQVVESIDASIIVFSDADTRFSPGFLGAVAAGFSDVVVGAVQAHLLYFPAGESSLVVSQERYWRMELEIRRLEAELGILAVASGACIAVRRDLWLPLDAAYGEDCMIPLDVVLQGSKVAYAPEAVAYEPEDDEFDDVIRNRTRMTVRNWQGTWSRAALLNPFAHPGYAFSLWSHKILRWMSPIWLLGLTVCAFALPVAASNWLSALPAVALAFFYLAAIVGGLGQVRSRRIPACGPIYAFVMANLGFLGGLIKAMRGRTVSLYR